MEIKVTITKTKCPKCSYTYIPRKSQSYNICPKCKKVFSGDKND